MLFRSLGPCGYDVRCREKVRLYPLELQLVSTIEYFHIRTDLKLRVCNKSTFLRVGMINFGEGEPGWDGYLTLELMLCHKEPIDIASDTPVACVEFMRLEEPTEQPYGSRDKYQHQKPEPISAIFV